MTKIDLEQFFQTLGGKFQASGTSDFDSTIQYQLLGKGGGDWYMIIRGPKCEVHAGLAEKPDATLETSVEDFINMMTGTQEDIGWAFMQGRFNMTGTLMPLWRVLAFLRDEQLET